MCLPWLGVMAGILSDAARLWKSSFETKPRIRKELARDVTLLRSGQLDEVVWEFSRSGVTGLMGPAKSLLDKLNRFGISVRYNH